MGMHMNTKDLPTSVERVDWMMRMRKMRRNQLMTKYLSIITCPTIYNQAFSI
jgi:hypothetical protein